MYARFAAALGALAAGAVGVVIVALLLRSVPGPTSPSTSTPAPARTAASPGIAGGRIATPNEPGFPSPPPGAVVLAQEAGDRALALAVMPGLVRVSVLSPVGPGVAGLKVSLRLGGSSITATTPCGRGCYQAQVEGTPSSPVSV